MWITKKICPVKTRCYDGKKVPNAQYGFHVDNPYMQLGDHGNTFRPVKVACDWCSSCPLRRAGKLASGNALLLRTNMAVPDDGRTFS